MMMREALTLAATQEMLAAVARHIVANVDALTAADQAIGDGDHGIGMRRGFAAVSEEMQKPAAGGLDAPFKSAGMAIMSKTGGAAGAMFGTLFRSGGTALAGRSSFDADALATFLQSGLEAVEKRGGSRPGQKTMLDALAPAAEAAKKTFSWRSPGRNSSCRAGRFRRHRGDEVDGGDHRQGADAGRALARASGSGRGLAHAHS